MKQTITAIDFATLHGNPMPVYTCSTNYPTTLYDDFLGSLSYDKTKAINEVYSLGYITEEEAKQLKEECHARRNDTTNIMMYETFNKVTLLCTESTVDEDNLAHIERIFELSYDKLTNDVIDEINSDIVYRR